MRLRIFFLASIAATGMGTVAVAAPAQAAGQDRHCVIDVSSPGARATCYGSFTAAIAEATGGRITDAPDNAAAAVKDPRLAA